MEVKFDAILGALRESDGGASAGVTDVKVGGASVVGEGGVANIPSIPVFHVAACTEMGIILGTTSVQLAWKDPENVTSSGATLATWQRTVAVAKQNAFPSSVADGAIVAATSRNPATDTYPLPSGVTYANKNAYETNSVTVQVEDGNTVCIKLFSCNTEGTWNNAAANEYPTYTSYSWAQLADYADAGTFLQHVPIGSTLDMEHSDFPGHQWLVIDEDLFRRQNQAGGHTVALLSRYILFEDHCDAAETQWAVTQDTAAVTGVVYALSIGGVTTQMTEGTDWTAGDTSVTRDGVVYPIADWLEKNPNPNCGDGTNYTPQRNDLQWYNSSADANNWFTKQNLWDNASATLKARPGFMKNMPSAFKNCLVPCERTCYNHSSYRIRGRGEGGTYIASVFPLTLFETCGQAVGNINEGIRKSDYFDSNADRVAYKLGASTASYWWLASANTISAYGVYCVLPSGASSNFIVNYARGFRPACAFGKQVN